MIVLGLTGSIGMGKSKAAQALRRRHIPVHDADAEVHRLMGPGGAALARIEAAFPGSAGPKGIDRQILGKKVFGDGKALKRLEAILHPLVRRAEGNFLRACRRRRAPLAVLEIPLLFETKGERRCDYTMLVAAPSWVQERRVLARPGMNREKFRAIRARQMKETEKRKRADFVIPTGLGYRYSLRALRRALDAMLGIDRCAK